MPIDSGPARKASRWQFIHEAPACWSWRKLTVDDVLETVSEKSFSDYAFAVNDAINHGFQPRRDDWFVDTEHGVTRFRAGEPPAFVHRKEHELFPPRAVLEKPADTPVVDASSTNTWKPVSEQ